jgi:hypothetical protein
MKYSLLFVLLAGSAALNAVAPPMEKLDKNQQWVCTRWTWTGDVFDRQVQCRRWEKRFKP